MAVPIKKQKGFLRVQQEGRFARAREWLAHRIARLACWVEGTHYWTAPSRLAVLPPYLKARLCSRCGRIGKPFMSSPS